MTKNAPSSFRFKKTDHVGVAGAEHDTEYLSNCFIDTGNLLILEDVSDHRQILLGRTGSGKSALLQKLGWSQGERVIAIEPENLALTYVSTSTILQFFSEMGVNLDPFFKLLWRHVLIVEILNRHFATTKELGEESLLDRLRRMFCGTSKQDREMKEAIKYLQSWGEKFWEHTEFRVKEITKRLEDSLAAAISGGMNIPKVSVNATLKKGKIATEEQRAELITRGQIIVSEAQVQDLHKIIKLLDNVLSNNQKKYYIVIDGLDENWVEEKLRYKLIMALIQTTLDFFKVKNAKVIIALRRDLIERVFRLTRDSGFQEEKYQSMYLPIVWDKQGLVKVLDTRIAALVSRRYTKHPVTHIDLLPKHFRKTNITEYIGKITTRPRDIIAFFNSCIFAGENLTKLKTKELKDAEGEYSRSRLRALADEWSANYPSLLDFVRILHRCPSSFKVNTLVDTDIEELCLEVAIQNPESTGVLEQYAMKVVDTVASSNNFKLFLVQVFYRIGLVGLKIAPHESGSWVDELGRSISSAEVMPDTSVVVHPMYHRALGIAETL